MAAWEPLDDLFERAIDENGILGDVLIDQRRPEKSRLHKNAGHKPAGSPEGGQFTADGDSGSSGDAGSDPDPSEFLGDMPKTRGRLACAAHALKVLKERGLEKLHALSSVIMRADVIPIASDVAREALLKGAGQSNPLQGVPLQDVAVIASKALAWAWTKIKKKLGKAMPDDMEPADAVLEVAALLAEMMDVPGLELPSREEIVHRLTQHDKKSALRKNVTDESGHEHASDTGQFTSGGGGGKESEDKETARAEKEAVLKKKVAERLRQIDEASKEAHAKWEAAISAAEKAGDVRGALDLRLNHKPPSLEAERKQAWNDLPGDAFRTSDPAQGDLYAKHVEGDRWLVNDEGWISTYREESVREIFDGEIPGYDPPNHARTQERIDNSRRLELEFPLDKESVAKVQLTRNLQIVPKGTVKKAMNLTSAQAAEALWEGLPHELAKPRTIDGERVWVKRINSGFAVMNDGTNSKVIQAKKARTEGASDKSRSAPPDDE